MDWMADFVAVYCVDTDFVLHIWSDFKNVRFIRCIVVPSTLMHRAASIRQRHFQNANLVKYIRVYRTMFVPSEIYRYDSKNNTLYEVSLNDAYGGFQEILHSFVFSRVLDKFEMSFGVPPVTKVALEGEKF